LNGAALRRGILSPGVVIATLALFVALGGTGYAALTSTGTSLLAPYVICANGVSAIAESSHTAHIVGRAHTTG